MIYAYMHSDFNLCHWFHLQRC